MAARALAFVLFCLGVGATPLTATPLIALREAQNCAGCHPAGRGQRPPMERRCTLDCQGCHIDPAGGGPRNQWGAYYSHDQAAMLNILKPTDPLQDTSRFDLHYDGRFIQQNLPGKTRTFPMSSEFSLRVRPFISRLHLTYQNILLGRVEDKSFRIIREGDRRFRERYGAMVDALPFNTYVRAYRGQPMYGLRRPNHTLWIRQRIGLDQFATTDAVELGGTPNVPFFRVSQMAGDPYVSEAYRQKGTSFHGGMRGVTAGWHVNASGWDTSSEAHAIKMHAFGAGANLFSFLLYGERNWRKVKTLDATIAAAAPMQPHPASTISEYSVAYAGLRGVAIGLMREELSDASRESERHSVFLDLHPIPFVQLELWRRQEAGTREFTDTVGIVHLYADF